jgi:hypothetical protein
VPSLSISNYFVVYCKHSSLLHKSIREEKAYNFGLEQKSLDREKIKLKKEIGDGYLQNKLAMIIIA